MICSGYVKLESYSLLKETVDGEKAYSINKTKRNFVTLKILIRETEAKQILMSK